VEVQPQVSETTDSNEHRLSGTTRLFTGFVIGALFALGPMYYLFMGREASLPEGHAGSETVVASPGPLRDSRSADVGNVPFASRMTYELSRVPEEPLMVVARPAAPAAVPAPRPAPRVVPAEPPVEARIVDARPINTRPPDPRDRTAAIEQEAQNAEYGDTSRRDAVAVRAPKVFGGRDVDHGAPKLAGTPTKPIGADPAASPRSPEAGVPVSGVTPITRPPEPASQRLATAKSAPPAPAEGADKSAGASVDTRLVATRKWLEAAATTTHTIQLMGASSEAQLDAQLKTLGRILEPSRLYVYRTRAQGRPSITVVYGEYADRKSALQALEKLPPPLVANKPVLRTVNGIRAEMKQHKTDG
jgi:septal ring-binding cell division protein DamX